MRAWTLLFASLFPLAGCMTRSPPAVSQAPPAAVGPPASKRIIYDGAGSFTLPDGTIVAADSSGGFTLPNGAYVAPDGRGGLVLPNGMRCVSDGAQGYVCP
jgi:hypothetical protein